MDCKTVVKTVKELMYTNVSQTVVSATEYTGTKLDIMDFMSKFK
jgi:hypothetical protein